jgi:hypothetical protein
MGFIIINIQIIFVIFLKLINMIFNFFKQWNHFCSEAKNTVWLLIFIISSIVLLIWLHCIKIFWHTVC